MADTRELQLAQARQEILQVREWLARPNTATLTACEPALERAVTSMQALSQQLDRAGQRPPPHLKTVATELAEQIQEVQTLLAAAGRLYFGRMHKVSE